MMLKEMKENGPNGIIHYSTFSEMYQKADFSFRLKSDDDGKMALKILDLIRDEKGHSIKDALDILDDAKAIMMECVPFSS